MLGVTDIEYPKNYIYTIFTYDILNNNIKNSIGEINVH